MKKQFSLLFFSLLFALLLSSPVQAAGSETPSNIVFNDELITLPDPQAFIKDGTTYIPLRSFSDLLGITLSKAGEKIVLQKEGTYITFDTKNSKLITSDGTESAVELFIKEGRYFVPSRAIAQTFGYNITYYSQGRIVRITDGNAQLSNEQLYEMYKDVLVKEPQKPSKVAYLTFDDGPNQHTAKILDVLEKYDAKATFFMMKYNMEKNQAVVKRMVTDGHGLGCHGVTHDRAKFYKSPQSAVNEMTSCQKTITNVSGVTSTLIRVPYGSKPSMTTPYRDAMSKAGYTMWDWNVDSTDWKLSSAKAISNHTIAQINKIETRGETPVILMHDRALTVSALPEVIGYLQKQGYSLEPLTGDMKEYNFWNK
ncbi:polysaccharide deacetylase family protein [Anaerobacillus sp. MEB173]|uniref:polysaccharide deacetylase family protein n=1 Tax=Anaerobacillus sp. MEB173 TaxID=3383345 RepID=UPI003F934004